MLVLVDGAPLPDAEGRALWQRFSDWMEEHKGDLAGFARAEGFASIHPGVRNGRPVLLASKSAPQRPYAPVGRDDAGPKDAKEKRGDRPAHGGPRPGGSATRQPEGSKPDRPRRNGPPGPGKPRKSGG